MQPPEAPRRHGGMPRRAPLLPLIASLLLLSTRASGQCGTVANRAPFLPITPLSIAERGGGPVIIPTLVHVHYNPVVFPITPDRIANAIARCNTYMRAQNDDLGEVHPAFQGLVGDLGVELRLATIDANGQCTSGIIYHWHPDQYEQFDVWSYAQNTASYLNIHVTPGVNSWTVVPSPGFPVSGDLGDGIFFTTYDAQFRPELLAHEVGHWLGLYHTFGQTNTSAVECGDDWIADTPITKGSAVGSCDQNLSECTPGVIENVDNHMDYSLCGKMFTQGQAAHVGSVVMDPAIARYPLHQPANLDATGVFLDPTCAMSNWAWHRSFPGCDSTRLEYYALASGRVPDSVRWVFPGGSPASSTETLAHVYYTSSGLYTAQLMSCIDGTCSTFNYPVQVTVNNAGANGLPLVTAFPFTEGFEDGFTLPQPHMHVVDDGTPTWQPYNLSGFASGNSLYVPAELLTENDTCDLVIGNFDFSQLSLPTFSMKVAVTQYNTGSWHTLELRFRELCSTTFSTGAWAIWQLNEMNVPNSSSGFAPTADDQWATLSAQFPVWTQSTRAELVLRLRRPWMPPSFTPEGFWIDDIRLGDPEIQTAVAAWESSTFSIAPNPANGLVTVHGASDGGTTLQAYDPTGRTMLQMRITGTTERFDVSGWPAGIYLLRLTSTDSERSFRLVVE